MPKKLRAKYRNVHRLRTLIFQKPHLCETHDIQRFNPPSQLNYIITEQTHLPTGSSI